MAVKHNVRKVNPGETLVIEPGDGDTNIMRHRRRRVKDPLKVLIGKKSWFKEPIDQDKLDEMGEDVA